MAQYASRAIIMPSCVLLSMCMPFLLGLLCAQLSVLALCRALNCQVDSCLLYSGCRTFLVRFALVITKHWSCHWTDE